MRHPLICLHASVSGRHDLRAASPPYHPPACPLRPLPSPPRLQTSVSGMISVLETNELQGTWHDFSGKVVPW